jgi:peptide/nickel transport system permease protein
MVSGNLAQRLLAAVLTVWLAATLSFFALRVLPGDAISAQLAQGGAGRDDIERARARMGLGAPVAIQYTRFMSDLVRGDLGYSLLSQYPVREMIWERFQPTVKLALSAIVVAAVVGVGLGIIGAFESPVSVLSRLLITLSISAPIYWTGTLAIALFSAHLGWLPSTGTGKLEHLILPVGVLSFHTMGGIARVTQVNVKDVRHASFVWVARSKGLTERYIVGRHILRVGLLPVVTVIALQTGFLLGGTVITESLFVRPGIGRLLLDSTIKQDYPVVQGIVILSAMVYITLTTLADVSHRLIDPRVAF